MTRRRKILFAFFCLLSTIIILELLGQLIIGKGSDTSKCRQQDKILHHSLVPNSSCKFKSKEWNVDFNVNALGFREDYNLKKKSDGTFRILVLGDSFTEGFGVQSNQVYLNVAEKLLNDSGKNVEIINAGVTGWSPIIYYLFLCSFGFELDPDLVIVSINSTDFAEDPSYFNQLTESGKRFFSESLCTKYDGQIFFPDKNGARLLQGVQSFLRQNFLLYQILDLRLRKIIWKVSGNTSSDQEHDLFLALRPEFDFETDRSVLSKTRDAIFKINSAVLQERSQIMVFAIPHGHVLSGQMG